MDTDTIFGAVAVAAGLYLAPALAHAIRVIRYARSPRRRLDQRLSQIRR
jgi:hypothetical protein